MIKPRENKDCYLSPIQREVLLELLRHPAVEQEFFLTGGTALSVFYLHHRQSNDLDFFTLASLDFSEIDFWIKGNWPRDCAKIKESPNFLSYLIRETKVDFVVDPLSNHEVRGRVSLENGRSLSVDTIENIVSNKFCTIVGRNEPKDFIDFYFLLKSFPEKILDDVYKNARLKDAIFDDPPTAAYQIEEALAFMRDNPSIFPPTIKEINYEDFFKFYSDLSKWLYQRVDLQH